LLNRIVRCAQECIQRALKDLNASSQLIGKTINSAAISRTWENDIVPPILIRRTVEAWKERRLKV